MKTAKILIVEDEAIIAMELESQLQDLGHTVTSIVNTGKQAIEKAEKDTPDLILMDIRVKGELDGIEAAEIIKNRFDIPIVFSTAYLDEKRIERVKITMPFGYILKPIQERDLRVTIETALYVSGVDKERKQMEEKVKKSQALLKKAEKIAHLGTWKLNYLTKEIECSDGLFRIFGIQAKDEHNFRFLKNGVKTIHPDDRESVIKVSETAIQTKKPFKVEYRIVHPDGTERKAIKRGKIICNNAGDVVEVIGIIQDITDGKKIEDELYQSKELFRALSDASFEAIFLSEKGICIGQNRAAEQMFGYGHSEAIGKLGTQWIATEYRDLVKKNMSTGYEELYEVKALHKGGKTFPAEIQGKMIYFQGKTVRVTVLRDITHENRQSWRNKVPDKQTIEKHQI